MAKPAVSRSTGPGKYNYHQNGPDDFTVLLFNYDIDGSSLKHEHQDFLKQTVVPLLKAGGSVTILGHASTTGTADHDLALGAGRANGVLVFLRQQAGTGFLINRMESRGKSMPLALGLKDNAEDPEWRAVWVRVWNKPGPPPNLGNGKINPNVPPLPTPGINTLGTVIDLTAGVLGIVDLGIDIAGLYAAGIATGVGGLILSSLSSIIAMPAIWASADNLAQFNGTVQGYADAMQDMADQYKDPALDRKPVREWPALIRPTPHSSGNTPSTTSERFWRQGQAKGAMQAYLDVLKLEADPVTVDATVNGQPRKVKVNGKVSLRAFYVSTKGNVAGQVITQMNDALRKQGKPPFPTH